MGTSARLHALRYRRTPYEDERARGLAVSDIRSRLVAGSDEAEVFELYVVERLTGKASAGRLHISRRQLYRVYAKLLDTIEQGLRYRLASAVPIVSQLDLDLERARSLLVHGRAGQSSELLDRLLLSRPDPRRAVSALCLRARARADVSAFRDSDRCLDDACRVIAGLPNESRLGAAREVAMTRSYTVYCGGFYQTAIAIAEEALERGAPPAPATDPQRREIARDLIFAGVAQQEGGEGRRAIAHLRDALGVLEAMANPPAAELAQVQLQLAIADSGVAADLTGARARAEEALRIAQWHGLPNEVVWANLALGYLELVSGNRSALGFVAAALDVARVTLEGDPLVRTLFVASHAQMVYGSPRAALALLDEAQPHLSPASLMGGIMEICRACTYDACGDESAALMHADRAIHTIGSRAETHYVGAAYLTRAGIASRRGLDCRDDAERAVYYYERGAPLRDYAEALELFASVTGDAGRARLARDVRHALVS